MLYTHFDSYGYKEPEQYVTLQQQKKFKYNPVKNVETSVFDGDSFYTETDSLLLTLLMSSSNYFHKWPTRISQKRQICVGV